MSTQQSHTESELIIRLSGGEREGELVPVSTRKCYLGGTSPSHKEAKCAIFRGPAGVAIRSYSDQVLINGSAASVHWLKSGDRIEIADEFSFEIEQLGFVDAKTEDCGRIDLDADQAFENTSDTRLGQLESSLQELQNNQDAANERFEKLDEQLHSIVSQLAQLAEMSVAAQPVSESTSAVAESDDESRFDSVGFSDEPDQWESPAPETFEATPIEHNSDEVEVIQYQLEDEETILGFDASAEEEERFINDFSEEPVDHEAIAEQSATIESRLDDFMDRIHAENENEQPANELTTSSFEDQTHSQDEVTDSFADPTPSEAQHNEEEAYDPSAEPGEESTMSTPTAGEGNNLQDVLARMKESGQWDGIPDDDSPFEAPVASTPQPQQQASVPTPAGGEPDVEDYMSQLLNRMRGDAPAAAVAAAAAPVKSSSNNDSGEEKPKETAFVPPRNPLKAEEFKPKQKAQKPKSFEAMRELANSSARTAVQKRDYERRRALGFVQVGIAVGSLMMAAYYYTVASAAAGDLPFLIGVVCSIVSIFFCIRSVNTFSLTNSIHLSDDEQPAQDEAKMEEAVAV